MDQQAASAVRTRYVVLLSYSGHNMEKLFYDGTLRPGRWTVMVCENKIDIMQRAMILNEKEEMLPLQPW